MGELVLKELTGGHSGSKVYLMLRDGGVSVRKVGNISRNLERYRALESFEHLGLPMVLGADEDNQIMEIEYIHSLDMRTYLLNTGCTDILENFIRNSLWALSSDSRYSQDKDYSSVYYQALRWIDTEKVNVFKFKNSYELMKKLPKFLPCTAYLGDLTLDNILFGFDDNRFHIIDPVTVPYDSYVFDVAKLRQDLVCKWFLRNSPESYLDNKLNNIESHLREFFRKECFDDNLLILMLLRVYRHCEPGSKDQKFIIDEVNKLWK